MLSWLTLCTNFFPVEIGIARNFFSSPSCLQEFRGVFPHHFSDGLPFTYLFLSSFALFSSHFPTFFIVVNWNLLSLVILCLFPLSPSSLFILLPVHLLASLLLVLAQLLSSSSSSYSSLSSTSKSSSLPVSP